MNWGWKIVVVYALFVLMTLFMVFYFMRQEVDLVAQDYYKQEIEYQDQMDKISNAKLLREPVTFDYSSSERKVTISFPASHVSQGIMGKVYFYRPSNAEEDREFEVSPNRDGQQNIAVGSLTKGLWRVKISWTSNDTEYFDEKTVTL